MKKIVILSVLSILAVTSVGITSHLTPQAFATSSDGQTNYVCGHRSAAAHNPHCNSDTTASSNHLFTDPPSNVWVKPNQ
jgi:hypothetical protein